MFDAWRASDAQKQKIALLWVFIGVLLVIIGLFWSSLMGIKGALRHQRLYLTPANVLQGGYYKTNTVSPAFVYGFAYQMLVAVNTWSTDARVDYPKAITTYRYYLTPEYRTQLQNDFHQKSASGDLLDSVQTLAPFNGMGFRNGAQVKQVSQDSWVVDMKLRVTRYKDQAILMDALYDYKVRVVRSAQSLSFNPWGLALAGLVSKTRLKTFV